MAECGGSESVRSLFDFDSRLGQQPSAADLGCTLVECPQRLLASMRGERDVLSMRWEKTLVFS